MLQGTVHDFGAEPESVLLWIPCGQVAAAWTFLNKFTSIWQKIMDMLRNGGSEITRILLLLLICSVQLFTFATQKESEANFGVFCCWLWRTVWLQGMRFVLSVRVQNLSSFVWLGCNLNRVWEKCWWSVDGFVLLTYLNSPWPSCGSVKFIFCDPQKK